jgi:hypothetical protein
LVPAAKKPIADEDSEDGAPLKLNAKILAQNRNITNERGDNHTKPPNQRSVRCNGTSQHEFPNAALREGPQRIDGDGGAGSSAAKKKQKVSNGEGGDERKVRPRVVLCSESDTESPPVQIADELQNPKNGPAAQASSHPSTGGKKPPEGGWARQQVTVSKDDSEGLRYRLQRQLHSSKLLKHTPARLDNSTSGDRVKDPPYSGPALP